MPHLSRSACLGRSPEIAIIRLHSLPEAAKLFYMSQGFIESPLDPMTLMLPIEVIRDGFEPVSLEFGTRL